MHTPRGFSAARCPFQALDGAFLQYTIAGTIASSGQSVMLLFAFEYVILASTVVRYALKYGMSMVDLAMDGNWQGKVRGLGARQPLRRAQGRYARGAWWDSHVRKCDAEKWLSAWWRRTC